MTSKYDTIAFSHRPELGVSIGAFLDNGVIVLAAAIVNQDSEDIFNSGLARRIIRNRVRDLVEGRVRESSGRPLDRFVTTVSVGADTTAQSFMNALRSVFKPDPQEGDDTFYTLFEIPRLNIEGRSRMDADEIWTRIVSNAEVAESITL
jgi:hypothetical protein